jgi:hypothetical protein
MGGRASSFTWKCALAVAAMIAICGSLGHAQLMPPVYNASAVAINNGSYIRNYRNPDGSINATNTSILLDCVSVPPGTIVDNVLSTVHFRLSGSPFGCFYYVRCHPDNPYWLLMWGSANTGATMKWYGGDVLPVTERCYAPEPRNFVVMTVLPNANADLYGVCVPRPCRFADTGGFPSAAYPNVITYTPLGYANEQCDFAETCPVGLYSVARVTFAVPGRKFSANVPVTLRRVATGPVVYPTVYEPINQTLKNKFTGDLVMDVNTVVASLSGADITMDPVNLTVACYPRRCTWNETTKGVNFATGGNKSYSESEVLLFADCRYNVSCNAARNMQPTVQVTGTCRNVTSDTCAAAALPHTAVVGNVTAPPCSSAWVNFPRIMNRPRCDESNVSLVCKSVCSSPNNTAVEYEVPTPGILWFANDLDGRAGAYKVAKWSECIFRFKCPVPTLKVWVNFTGQLNAKDTIVAAVGPSDSFTFSADNAFDNLPMTVDTSSGWVSYSSAVDEQSDKPHENSPGPGMSISVQCAPLPTITCPPNLAVHDWATKGVLFHQYVGRRPLLDLCSWSFKCPAHMFPGVEMFTQGGYSAGGLNLTVTGTDGNWVHNEQFSALIFGDTPQITATLRMRGVVYDTTGLYSLKFDCYIARCWLNSTSPWVRNGTVWTDSVDTAYKYQNNTKNATQRPPMQVNADCTMFFACPNPNHYLGVYVNGYPGNFKEGGAYFSFNQEYEFSGVKYWLSVATFADDAEYNFGYLMSGPSVQVRLRGSRREFGGDKGAWKLTFNCFIEKCTNNKTADYYVQTIDSPGGPVGINVFPDFRYYINEDCHANLTCRNPDHFIAFDAAIFLADTDVLEATDGHYKFRLPTFLSYSEEARKDGGHPTRNGFLFRQPSIDVKFTTTRWGRGGGLGSGRHWFSIAYCLQSTCGSNVTYDYMAATTTQREEHTWMGGTTWGDAQLLNTECSFRTTCPAGSFATVRYHSRWLGASAMLSINDLSYNSVFIDYNMGFRGENNVAVVTLSNLVPPAAYLQSFLLNGLGDTWGKGHGISLLFGCVGVGADCVYTNSSAVTVIPTHVPAVSPFFVLDPSALARYNGVVFAGELCYWQFHCPDPTMYLLVVKTLASMAPSTKNQDVNMTAVDRSGNRVWDIFGGQDLLNSSSSIFLDQGQGFLLTLAPSVSQRLTLMMDVRCYVAPCCNNATQPVALSAATLDEQRKPERPLVPVSFNFTACDGMTRNQKCTWTAAACPSHFTRLVRFPAHKFMLQPYPVPVNSSFRGRLPFAIFSSSSVSISYLTGKLDLQTPETMFPLTGRVIESCVLCNATDIATSDTMIPFTDLVLPAPHYCTHTMSCPANKFLKLEIRDSTFSTTQTVFAFTFDNQSLAGPLPYGTRESFVFKKGTHNNTNTVEFGYRAVADAATGKDYSSPVFARYFCMDEPCAQQPPSSRAFYTDVAKDVLTNAFSNVGNQRCSWSLNVNCVSKCETTVQAKLSVKWPTQFFTTPQPDPSLQTGAGLLPSVTFTPLTSGEPSWLAPNLTQVYQTSPRGYREPHTIAIDFWTAHAGLFVDSFQRLPRITVTTGRTSVTRSLLITPSESLNESLSESISVTGSSSPTPTTSKSLSDTFSDGTTTVTESPPVTDTPSWSLSESATVSESRSMSPTATTSLSASVSVSMSESASQSVTTSVSDTESPSSSVSQSSSVSESLSLSASVSLSPTGSLSVSPSESFSTSLSVSFSDTSTIVTNPSIGIVPDTVNQNVISRPDLEPAETSRTFVFLPMGEQFDYIRWVRPGKDHERFREIFIRIRVEERSTKPTGFMANIASIWKPTAIRDFNATAMVVVLEPTTRYYSLVDDTVTFHFDPELFALKYFPVSDGYLSLAKPHRGSLPDPIKNATRDWAGALSMVSGYAALQAQRSMMLMSLEACEPAVGPPLPFTDYPIGEPVGDNPTQYLLGATLFNPALLVGIFLCHVGLCACVAAVTRRPFAWSTQLLRFPNFDMIPGLFLAGSTVTSSAAVVLHDPDTVWRIVGGVFSVLWLGLPLSVAYLTMHRRKFAAVAVDESNLYERDNLETFVKGRFAWRDDPDREDSEGFCRRYSLLFNAYKPNRRWFLIGECITSYCTAYIGAVMPDDGDCSGIGVALLVVYILYVAALLCLSPYITPLEMMIALAVGIMQAAGYGFALMAMSSDKFESLTPMSSYFAMASVVLTTLLVACDLGDRAYATAQRLVEKVKTLREKLLRARVTDPAAGVDSPLAMPLLESSKAGTHLAEGGELMNPDLLDPRNRADLSSSSSLTNTVEVGPTVVASPPASPRRTANPLMQLLDATSSSDDERSSGSSSSSSSSLREARRML